MAFQKLRPQTGEEKRAMHERINLRQTLLDCEIGYNHLKGRTMSKTSLTHTALSNLHDLRPFLIQARAARIDPATDTQTTQAIKSLQQANLSRCEKEALTT